MSNSEPNAIVLQGNRCMRGLYKFGIAVDFRCPELAMHEAGRMTGKQEVVQLEESSQHNRGHNLIGCRAKLAWTRVKRGAGGGTRTLTGRLSPADFHTVYGFRRPDVTLLESSR